jgi:glycosyltransferase involved in cell wall biosynthesis
MNCINLHIYPSPITHESRMLKETKSISDAQLVDEIFLVGMWEHGLESHEPIDATRKIWRVRPIIGNQDSTFVIKALRYIEWQLRILWRFRFTFVKYVNCHSLPVLPLGVLFKVFRKAVLVYDTHEIETESIGAVGFRKKFFKLVERLFIRIADAVITVNSAIMEWYRKEYKIDNVVVVRNIPYQRQHKEIIQNNLIKNKFGIKNDEILFIYQGSLGHGRGIEIILDTFSRVNCTKHVLFMGFGEFKEIIKNYERQYSNIHFLDAVKPADVGRYTSGADVGLCLHENIGLNYYLSLPNKLYEYIINEVPVIVSDFPEMGRVVDESECGWKVSVGKDHLYSLITNISKDDIDAKRKRARIYRKIIGWEIEEKILINLYRHTLAVN